MIILNMSNIIRNPSLLKIVQSFSNLEFVKKISFVSEEKKVLQYQNKYQINQNLVLRVWFALLNSRHNKLILEFWKFFEQLFPFSAPSEENSLVFLTRGGKISLVFVYLSKKLPKHFLSICQIK